MSVSIYLDRGLLLYCCAVALMLGAALGSFLNCAAWRIAHGESFVTGRSRCPDCGRTLGALDLVPVFSWLFLRGKCRFCGKKISPRYPLTEVLFALITLACLLRFDLTATCARNLVFLCCLFCLSLVDMECYIIPDGCLIIAACAWAVAALVSGVPWTRAVPQLCAGLAYGGGMLLISLIMDRILNKESMGGGDIKLFAVVGLYLGWVGTLFALLLSCVLGLLLVRLLRRGPGEAFPFGPAIAASAAVMLLFGDGAVAWYLNLTGY